MTKAIKLCACIGIMGILALSGCSGKTEVSTSENEVVSLADEIAAGVSEDVVPDEAHNFSKLSFDIPEGMVEDSENTEDMAYYFSSDVDDLSFIQYRKTARDEKADYSAITQESYEESLESQLGNEVQVYTFAKESKEGYDLITVQFGYKLNDVPYSVKSYIFITGGYVFCVDYSLGANTNLEEGFLSSQSSLKLESIVDSVPVN